MRQLSREAATALEEICFDYLDGGISLESIFYLVVNKIEIFVYLLTKETFLLVVLVVEFLTTCQ